MNVLQGWCVYLGMTGNFEGGLDFRFRKTSVNMMSINFFKINFHVGSLNVTILALSIFFLLYFFYILFIDFCYQQAQAAVAG